MNTDAPQQSKQALAHIRVKHMVLGFMQVRLVLRGWKYCQQYVPNQHPIASDTLHWFPRPHTSNFNTVWYQASDLSQINKRNAYGLEPIARLIRNIRGLEPLIKIIRTITYVGHLCHLISLSKSYADSVIDNWFCLP